MQNNAGSCESKWNTRKQIQMHVVTNLPRTRKLSELDRAPSTNEIEFS